MDIEYKQLLKLKDDEKTKKLLESKDDEKILDDIVAYIIRKVNSEKYPIGFNHAYE